jgi:predicted DNA-binding mobile mystery protein A
MSSKSANQALARKQLDRRLGPLRQPGGLSPPEKGWLRAVRDALGMTASQFAKRIGVTQPRISALEKAEADGAVTLATLRHAAEGLGCTLVYALVPNQSLDGMLEERAREIVACELARTHHTMILENQALEPAELEAQRERLIAQLIQDNPRRLWETP